MIIRTNVIFNKESVKQQKKEPTPIKKEKVQKPRKEKKVYNIITPKEEQEIFNEILESIEEENQMGEV